MFAKGIDRQIHVKGQEMISIAVPLDSQTVSPNVTIGTGKMEFIFPGFVSLRPNGVFVDIRALSLASGGFELFVDRLFMAEMQFQGLDYSVFTKLLYDADWLDAMQDKAVEAKMAEKVVEFPQDRKDLYHAVKLLDAGNRAEYVFEPVSIPELYKEPVYGEPDENGNTHLISYVSKSRLVPAKLNFDEFVADLWLKGIKFGIDVSAVREAMVSNTPARITVARHLEPTTGRDAEILEVCPDLHRDNSPKIMLNGKADLRVFKNRFPQISKGKRLLKKISRVLGKPGYRVTGEMILPRIPNDIDLYALASLGTMVALEKDGEYIISTMDGFLTIDTKSNLISVAEKIETDSGISIRTTGDLTLDVDEFVEHGEVQEGRRVEGKHMTFLADVFGNILSNEGNIFISGSLSGGRAETHGGNITLGSNASRAVILAPEGTVTIHYCEHSTIIGRVVHIEHAVNCEIVADEVIMELSEGCLIAAEKVSIASSGERRGKETLVTLMIPDLAEIDQKIVMLKKKMSEELENKNKKLRDLDTLKSDLEFVKFLSLQERIKSGAIKLTVDHAANWRKMMERNAKSSNLYAKLNAEMAVIELELQQLTEEHQRIVAEREGMGEGIACSIAHVTGQTTGQTMKSINGIGIFNGKSSHDIRTLLQKVDSHKARIFSEDLGSVNWKYARKSGG